LEFIVNRNDSTFFIDLGAYDISGWNFFDIDVEFKNGTIQTFGPYMMNFLMNPVEGIAISDLTLEPVFSEYDELFAPEMDISLGLTDDMDLFSRTYYQIQCKIVSEKGNYILSDPFENEIPAPQPTLRCQIEGKTFHLRPIDGNGSFKGIFRTPSGYTNNKNDGLMISVSDKDPGSYILKKEVRLERRQAPDLRLSPDPFHLSGPFSDGFRIEFEEGWELTNYRKLGDDPSVMIDNRSIEMIYQEVDVTNDFDRVRYYQEISEVTLLQGGEMTIDMEATYSMEIYVSFIFFYVPFPIIGIGVPIWFILISAAILVSLIFMGKRSVFKRITIGKGSKFTNPIVLSSDLSILGRTFAAAFFFSWSISILFDLIDQPTPGLEVLQDQVPVWIRMVLLAEASVWEEVVSRIMFIGLPLFIIKGKGMKIMDRSKFLFGGFNEFGKSEIILILISSSIFGLAHLGWGPWKVLPTFIAGALFGYLYIRVGLHAAIAMHFLFDYSGFIFDLFEGIPFLPYSMLYLILLFTGGFFLAKILSSLLRKFESGSGKKLDPRIWLITHSILSMVVLTYIWINDGNREYMFLLSMVLPLNITGYFLKDWGDGDLSNALIAISSLLTFALAPLGLMWIFTRDRKVTDPVD
jgi:hypothetical protein